ncbi:MAG: hypothetical protein P8105_07050 [Dehalococcoidia bacterium]
MVLSGLLSLIDSVPSYRELTVDLFGAKYKERELTVPSSGRPYFVAAICRKLRVPVIVVTPQTETAKRLVDELQIWSPPSTSIRMFPETDPLEGRSGVNGFDTARERMEVLSMLAFWNNDENTGVDRPLIVSTASADRVLRQSSRYNPALRSENAAVYTTCRANHSYAGKRGL